MQLHLQLKASPGVTLRSRNTRLIFSEETLPSPIWLFSTQPTIPHVQQKPLGMWLHHSIQQQVQDCKLLTPSKQDLTQIPLTGLPRREPGLSPACRLATHRFLTRCAGSVGRAGHLDLETLGMSEIPS